MADRLTLNLNVSIDGKALVLKGLSIGVDGLEAEGVELVESLAGGGPIKVTAEGDISVS